MRLTPAATAASIAVWCSRIHSGSSLIGMSVSTPTPGGEILFLCRRRPRPRVGPKVSATLLAWVM
jgi:hypothetical protein